MTSSIRERLAAIPDNFKNNFPGDQPISFNIYTSIRGAPVVSQMIIAGGGLGFLFGTLAYASEGRKHYRTLLEDLAEPKQRITIPKTSSFSVLATRTALLFGKTGKGCIHGAIYGSSLYYLRDVWGFSDRASVFGSGIAFTLAGKCLCKLKILMQHCIPFFNNLYFIFNRGWWKSLATIWFTCYSFYNYVYF